MNVLGFQTHRDHFAVAFTRGEMEARVRDMRNPALSDEQLRAKYGLRDNRDWRLAEARKKAARTRPEDVFLDCLYRPFDVRPCYFSYEAMDYPRRELMDHVAGKANLCLLASRQQGTVGFRHVFLSDSPANDCVVSNRSREANQCFMLYQYPSNTKGQGDLLAAREKRPNLADGFVEAVSERLGLAFDAAAHRGLHRNSAPEPNESTWNPEDLFCYAYAVFHAPAYRQRYAEFLKVDFPRLPLTSDRELFFRLADLGEELVRLHLMHSPKLDDFLTRFPQAGTNIVERVRYQDGCVWINSAQCFEGVEEADWNFHIGGYQVLAKWLKDRKGRTLSFDDIEHWQKIVVAIHETRRLMADIDAAIPAWPLASD
ncbi:MAG: hypothetical protein D6678_06815 [Zetaproteobacteria bacterium]|nr:MAG: hypothetical protein D6678_06815 [Zetaproteobacteria bacterium]